MRTASLCLVLAACLQAETILSGSGSKGGVSFRYETRIEPDLPNQKFTGFGAGGIIAAERFHRYLVDAASHRYFGYDLSIEPEHGAFRISFYPLSLDAQKLELDTRFRWTLIPIPNVPSPQLVHAGDTLALDLFVHPVTGQRIVDYLHIQDERVSIRLPNGPARDYTVNDVPLTLSKPRLNSHGKTIDKWDGSITGQAVSYYVPGDGRYVLSLIPHPELGMRRSGEIRGSALTFGPYTVECDAPIAPGGGVFHLYVHHDPAWKPSKEVETARLMASDARSLIRR